MKKTILICGLIVLLLTGCSTSTKEKTTDIHSFEGTIVECEQKSMIVRPNESEDEYKSSDKFKIDYVDGFDSCNVGDVVKITYEGEINEIYPAQISVTKIELKSEEKNNVLKKINSIVENGPIMSSNPFDYIKASQKTYDELLDKPEETFRYAFSDLIQSYENNKSDLINYIEALLCSEINTNFKYDFESASDYIEKYKEFLSTDYKSFNKYDIYAKLILNEV